MRTHLPPIAGGATYPGQPVCIVDGSGNQVGSSATSAMLPVTQEGQNATYYIRNTWTPAAATTTDIMAFASSATLVWRLHLFRLWAHSTGGGAASFSLVLRTSPNSGGTLAFANFQRRSPTSPVNPTSNCFGYTAVPTPGALDTTGTLKQFFNVTVPTTVSGTPILVWQPLADEGNVMLPRMPINFAGQVSLLPGAALQAGFVVDNFEAVISEGAS